jgi:RNA recognition motif-containing protein
VVDVAGNPAEKATGGSSNSPSMASADVEFRCFVGGLAWATTDSTLERAFSQYGEILDSKVGLNMDRIRGEA